MNTKRENVLVYRKKRDRKSAVYTEASIRSTPKGKVRVGICDLDTCAGKLPQLLSRLEKEQDRFAFFSVEAPLQTGLTFPGPHVAAEWQQHTGSVMPREAEATNVSAQRIFAAAKPILKTLPVEWLVLVVQSMISDVADDVKTHNLFSTSSGKIALVSTFGLREYAAKGGRPFEAAVFQGMLSALLAMMVPKVEYLVETTGSIFDYCENRVDIVRSIRDPKIDPENRSLIPVRLLRPAELLLDSLKSYEGLVAKPKKADAGTRPSGEKPSGASDQRSALGDTPGFDDILNSLANFAKK